MLTQLLKNLFIAAVTIGLLIVGVVGVSAFGVWYDNTHKRLLQTVHVPARGVDYLLLSDIAGIGDRAWYVYERPAGAEATDAMLRAHDVTGTLFWNYSELGDHSGAPTLSVVGARFLVFARGGRYYSLYDLNARRVLVNDENPWVNFAHSREYQALGTHPSLKNLELAMDGWVASNLDAPIRETLARGVYPVNDARP